MNILPLKNIGKDLSKTLLPWITGRWTCFLCFTDSEIGHSNQEHMKIALNYLISNTNFSDKVPISES